MSECRRGAVIRGPLPSFLCKQKIPISFLVRSCGWAVASVWGHSAAILLTSAAPQAADGKGSELTVVQPGDPSFSFLFILPVLKLPPSQGEPPSPRSSNQCACVIQPGLESTRSRINSLHGAPYVLFCQGN